jgi:L-ascorbate metabolism protein UlaG (beta-lactamase superfamily)
VLIAGTGGVIFAALLVCAGCSGFSPDFDESAWHDRVTATDPKNLYAPHENDGIFFNPWMPMEEKSIGTLLRWRLAPAKDYTETEKTYLPPVVPDAVARIRATENKDFIFWVGHGTFFMRINGQYWLTDPMFSDRALLPKRKTPPGITIHEILAITDQVNCIISHNHYDHLDENSIRALPDTTRFFVPKGVKNFITDLGKPHVTEMDWWESVDLEDGTRLLCTPMQHWSRRIGQGFNTTLWASYLITAPEVSVYFDGDGGYFKGYREIGRRFPGIDYALIPITAYHPRWFMHYAHMNVSEAVRAFNDLGADIFIPTQWGVFSLGDEPAGYPALDLRRTIAEKELDAGRFLIMNIGGLHLIE